MDASTFGEEGNFDVDMDGSTRTVERTVEEGDRDTYLAEEQIHAGCGAKTLSCKSKTLACDISKTDWEGLEDTRLSSGAGKGRIGQSKMSTNFDSEPECRNDDGVPASGFNWIQLKGTVHQKIL